MTLGVNGEGQKWYEAIVTFLVVLLINVIILLPTQRFPTTDEWYSAMIQGLGIALGLYAINKGIQWKKGEAKKQ